MVSYFTKIFMFMNVCMCVGTCKKSSLRLLITPLQRTQRGLQELEYEHKRHVKIATILRAIVTRRNSAQTYMYVLSTPRFIPKVHTAL